MTVIELLPQLQQLKRADKLYIMQFLVSDLAQEQTDLLKPQLDYPIWSPHDATQAADVMLSVLNKVTPKEKIISRSHAPRGNAFCEAPASREAKLKLGN